MNVGCRVDSDANRLLEETLREVPVALARLGNPNVLLSTE